MMTLVVQHPDSLEAKLRLADIRIQRKGLFMGSQELTSLGKAHPLEWRVNWYMGTCMLMQDRAQSLRPLRPHAPNAVRIDR